MRKMYLILIFIPVILFVLGFIYSLQRLHSSLNLHPQNGSKTPSDYGLEYQDVSLVSRDGNTLKGWYIPTNEPKAFVILVHGYSDKIGGKTQMLVHAKYLNEAGYSTFLIDLRSFGGSEGTKITMGVNEWKDLSAAFDYVRSQAQGKKVGSIGISMGAVTSLIEAGVEKKTDFVIASVPFYSLDNLFTKQIENNHFSPTIFLPFMKLAAMVELGKSYSKYTPQAVLKDITAPTLIFAAKSDQHVFFSDGRKIFDELKGKKEYWEAESDHDIHAVDPKGFQDHVLSFLSEVTN